MSSAADDVRTSAGAKSQNHLNKSTVYINYNLILQNIAERQG